MAVQEHKTINLNAETRPLDRFFQRCIGSCHAYLTLREDFREHVRMVQKQVGFESLRCHGIFHDLVGIYSEDSNGEAIFNFHNVNKIYDFFLEQGLRPYVELSFMPQALASAGDTIFRYQANISPPKDYQKWANLISVFVRHLVTRYGLEEVKQWHFEVWNEPDLEGIFWSGTQAEYFELYRHTVTAIKGVCDQLLVGGPSTSKNLWIEEMMEFCEVNQLPMDFVSTHHYCADASLEVDADVFNLEYRGQKAMRSDVQITVDKVRASNRFASAEVHYSEWNVSPCHEDRYGKDSEFTAVFLLQTLKDLDGLVDSYSFWCLSDIFEETGPGRSPFSGKYGLVNMQGIKKPVFYAYHFLTRLYDSVLSGAGESSWITHNENGSVRVLSWNFNEPETVDFNGADYRLDEQHRSEALLLKGMDGRYRIKAYRQDREVGNSFRCWQALGEPEYLTHKQIDILKESAEPNLFQDQVVECEGELELTHQLSPCAIVFYDIEKLG
jgi:xylan 1,4-beta-xylosidase